MYSRRLLLNISPVVLVCFASLTGGFTVPPTTIPNRSCRPISLQSNRRVPAFGREATQLHLLVEVPDGFFTFTFPVLGIMLSISKSFGRRRMEERAWEQRLDEARDKRLLEDPTLTEIELRRNEAALEWSAYGKPEESSSLERERKYGGKRVRVMERDEDDASEEERGRRTPDAYRMTDEEIDLFEAEYGIGYDPYYDDPYTEDELPDDTPFSIDRRYGDRIYESGEIFYKDKESGLFYRQGAKPRSLSFWK
jgi:hypothetical protein